MLLVFGAFCTVCMAAHTFGKLLSPLGLPAITLFIAFGPHRAARTRPDAFSAPPSLPRPHAPREPWRLTSQGWCAGPSASGS